MTPSEWKAELEAALVRAMQYEREKREALYAARRACEFAPDTAGAYASVQDWLRDTDRHLPEMQTVLKELRKQEVKP